MMSGFSPYVQALAVWDPGVTVVWCYQCRRFAVVVDHAPTRTIRCRHLNGCDLLQQAAHLSAFQSEEE